MAATWEFVLCKAYLAQISQEVYEDGNLLDTKKNLEKVDGEVLTAQDQLLSVYIMVSERSP